MARQHQQGELPIRWRYSSSFAPHDATIVVREDLAPLLPSRVVTVAEIPPTTATGPAQRHLGENEPGLEGHGLCSSSSASDTM